MQNLLDTLVVGKTEKDSPVTVIYIKNIDKL